MKRPALLKLCVFSFTLLIAGCYQTQLRGPVGDARVTLYELNGEQPLQETQSWDATFLEAALGQQRWQDLDALGQLIFVGVFSIDPEGLDDSAYYLLSASGGLDVDTDQDLVSDSQGSEIGSEWHTILPGSELDV